MTTSSIRTELMSITEQVKTCKGEFHRITFIGNKFGYDQKDVKEYLDELNSNHLIPNPLSMNILLSSRHLKSEQKANLISGIKSFVDGLEDASSIAIAAIYHATQDKVNEKYGKDNMYNGELASRIFETKLIAGKGILGQNISADINEKLMKDSPLSQEEFKAMFDVSGYMETLTGEKQNYKRKDLNVVCQKLEKNGMGKSAEALREVIEARMSKSRHSTQDGPGI